MVIDKETAKEMLRQGDNIEKVIHCVKCLSIRDAEKLKQELEYKE